MDDVISTFIHVQKALRLMVGDLVGTSSSRGRTSQFILDVSKLRLLKTSSGSLVAEFDIAHPGRQMHLGHGQQAIDRILDWDGGKILICPYKLQMSCVLLA